jgi:hypothetical protein
MVMWATTIGLISLHGCDDRNECQRAFDHLLECLDAHPTDNGEPGPTFDLCEGKTLCAARCIDDTDCDAVKDELSGANTDVSKGLRGCVAGCGPFQ